MAHELTINRLTRKVEMAYLQGVDRWHGAPRTTTTWCRWTARPSIFKVQKRCSRAR